MLNNKLCLTSVMEFLRRGRVDCGTGGGKVVVVVDSSKRKVLIIFVKNIVARSFVNLNHCNQLVIRQKHVSYYLILNENTQRIPFIDRMFKGNRTQ